MHGDPIMVLALFFVIGVVLNAIGAFNGPGWLRPAGWTLMAVTAVIWFTIAYGVR